MPKVGEMRGKDFTDELLAGVIGSMLMAFFFSQGKWLEGLLALGAIIFLARYLDTIVQILMVSFLIFLVLLGIAFARDRLPALIKNPFPTRQAHSISVGGEVEVAINSTLRLTPGYVNKPVGDECGWLVPGDAARVVSGPRYADDLTWWLVEVKTGASRRKRGWIAEYNRDGKTMLQSVAAPTSTPSVSISPDQAVKNYYQLINDRQYDRTWAMLSDSFKKKFNCCNPDGSFKFDEYLMWWNSVGRVAVGRVEVLNLGENMATVYAELTYHMQNGKTIPDTEPRIQLTRDATSGIWLFYDKLR